MNTACCTIGWVNYANERSQAALGRSSQDAYDVIRLTLSKAAVWTVDDVARLTEFFKKNSYVFLPSVAYDPEKLQKLDRSQNCTKLYYILYIYCTNIQNVLSSCCTTLCTAGRTTGCKV